MSLTTDLNRLLDNARIRLPGVTDDVLKLETYNTLNEFFQSTNIWAEDSDFSVTAGVANRSFTISSAGPSFMVRILACRDADGFPIKAVLDSPGVVTIIQPIGADGVMTATVALTVDDPIDTDSLPTFPQWVLNKYSNEILDGLLGRVMSQAAKPYSNEKLAVFHTRNFQSAISQARWEQNRRNAYGGQRWAYPQAFSRRRVR